MFQAAKNLFVDKAAQLYLNNLIARYAVLHELKIDSQNRTIRAVCQLHGENEPLTVRVEEYLLQEKGGKKFLQIVKCTCSRPWAQNLIEDLVQGRQIEVPPWALPALA